MAKRQKTKEESQKIKEKSSISQEEANSLERMIEKNIKKIDSPELREILNEQKMQKPSPSLEKVNAPQRIPTRLEGNFIEDPLLNNNLKDETNNSIEYNLINKKNEPEYQLISQDNRAMQRESLKHNPNMLVKHQSFIDLDRKNIVENFPRRMISPIVDETLRDTKNTDKDYIVKSTFVEKERKIHNPFEKSEIKYDNFEQ